MKQAIESADVRTLRKLIQEIVSDTKNSIAKWLKAGELLTRIKSNTKHGDWNDVLQSVQVSYTTAYRYMALWARRSTINSSKIEDPSEAIKLLNDVPVKSTTVVEGTTQNEALTHEKTSNSETNSGAKSSPSKQRSVHDYGTDIRQTTEGKEKTRIPSSDAQKIPGNSPRTNLNGSPEIPEIQLDKTGYPIPENLIAEWDRATDQAMGWIRAFDAIHRQIMSVHGTDFAVAKINKSSLESDHSNYRGWIKQAVPYAVCPICQGKLPDKCKGCNPCNEEAKGKGLGWVNQRYWETCVPIELKKIRERAYGTKSPARLST